MPPPVIVCDYFHKTWANLETDRNLKSMIPIFSEKNNYPAPVQHYKEQEKRNFVAKPKRLNYVC
jgi:hypothetical protein